MRGDRRTGAEDPVDGALDDAAFVALYGTAAPRLHAYLARRLGPEAAEELTAEVFARAWAGRERYDAGRGDPVGWLFGIAMNLLRRHHRTAERRLRAYGRLPVDATAPDPAEGVTRAVDARRELEATARGLTRLSAMDRDMILLRAWADLSYQQIADAMGVDVGIVRTRLSRARARLAQSRQQSEASR